MKNVTKLLLTVFLLSHSFLLFSQNDAGFQFGIRVGGSLSSSTLKGAGKRVMPGYQVELTAEYALSEAAFLQTEASFTTKGVILRGTENIEGGGTGRWSQRFNLQYIQVPVMIAYKLEMDTDFHIYLRAGFYGAYGIGGKTTYKGAGKIEQDSFGDNGLKKFDMGARFGSGLEFEKYIVGFDFEYGFLDLSRGKNDLSPLLENGKFRNKGISLSVGYKF
jgi:opacity protein-like surface antigen